MRNCPARPHRFREAPHDRGPARSPGADRRIHQGPSEARSGARGSPPARIQTHTQDDFRTLEATEHGHRGHGRVSESAEAKSGAPAKRTLWARVRSGLPERAVISTERDPSLNQRAFSWGLVGATEPRRPALNRIAARTRKLGAMAAGTPTLPNASTIMGVGRAGQREGRRTASRGPAAARRPQQSRRLFTPPECKT